jgi:hypothetical protein
MAGPFRHAINMGSIPAAGIGGVGMLGLVIVIAYAFAEARYILLAGGVGGVMLGAAWIIVRRFHKPDTPSGDQPSVLFREVAEPSDANHPAAPDAPDAEIHHRVALVR